MDQDYLSVTELAGDDVSVEQIDRMCQRYYWAGTYCRGKDVLELGCGTGQGAGYLAGLAGSFLAGDYSEKILGIARAHYGDRILFQHLDAQQMTFGDGSFDVVILFEAIYYLTSAERFVAECRRVLRPGGKVLTATANKDLYDFNPSPHSHTYYGVPELDDLFRRYGFVSSFFGNTPVDGLSWRQRTLRPIKKFVTNSGLMPKTMAGKKILKRLVFGSLVPMPAEIVAGMARYVDPVPIPADRPDRKHKVLYCVATAMDR
jgi:ubiquinone/menaquinone biosynthesis C-methylase UbiE